jgi:vancomycin resistance protein YoaR
MSRTAPDLPGPVPGSPVTFLASIIALIAIGLGGLLFFELSNWDRITPGVSALGTPVGGLSRADAVTRLTPTVQQLLDRQLEIRGGGQAWTTSPRELGLRLDPVELAGAAYRLGREGSPFDRVGEQLGILIRGRGVSATSTTDHAALDAAVNTIARQIDRPPRDAQVALSEDGTVQSVTAQDGLAVDVPGSREQIAATLGGTSQTADLVIRAVPPAIADAEVASAREQLERLLAPDVEPFTLLFGEKTWRLENTELVKLLTLSGGRPGQPAEVHIDEAPLRNLAARAAKELDQPVQDARFRFGGGTLNVTRPSMQGRTVDQPATVRAIHAALVSGERRITLPVTVTEPSVASEDAASLGITEAIDRASTSFAGSIPEKKHNIKLAAERLSGVVVAPGATFSFNKAVGPTTIDAGFKWGFGIAAGNDGPRTVPAEGGGICQVATTLFQPVFWSGYQLEERYWHLYWIPAYTSRNNIVGLDVTVDGESGLDFKWTNTTGNYVLIQADTDEERVYFALYGKKPPWRVEVTNPVISNRTPPDTKPIARAEPTLAWGRTIAVETARDGFDVQLTRRVVPLDGGAPRELNLKSTYQPAHTVTLVGTAGKPASASVEDALQRVLDAQRPAPAPVAATPAAPAAQATPAGGAATAVLPTPLTANSPATPGAAASTPAAAPTAAAKPTAATPAPAQQAAPTAAPKPAAATPVPAQQTAPTAPPKPQATPTRGSR